VLSWEYHLVQGLLWHDWHQSCPSGPELPWPCLLVFSSGYRFSHGLNLHVQAASLLENQQPGAQQQLSRMLESRVERPGPVEGWDACPAAGWGDAVTESVQWAKLGWCFVEVAAAAAALSTSVEELVVADSDSQGPEEVRLF
jgi:hypothetical protein